MAAGEWTDEEDPFEAQRERVENPMKRLFRVYGEPNAAPLSIGIVASIGARLLDLVPPILLGFALDAIFRQDKAFTDIWFVPDPWIPGDQIGQLYLAVALIALTFAGAAVCHWVRNWGFNAFSQRIQHAIRTDTYDAMQGLDMDFFADKQTGELLSILSNDVNRLERFLNDGMNSVFRLSVMVFGIAGILFYYNWQLALVALVPVPLIALFTYWFIQVIQPKYAEVRSTVGKVNSRLENNLGGITVIKAATTEPYESDRVDDVSRDYFDANWDAIDTRIRFFPGLRLIAGIGFAITFLVGGLWVLSAPGEAPWIFTGALSVGEFVTFILLTQRFIWPMAQFGQIINMYQRARASSARVFGLMDERGRVEESLDAEPLAVTEGAVEYDSVTFGYGGDEDERGGDEDERGGDEDERGGDEDDRGGDEDERESDTESAPSGISDETADADGADAEDGIVLRDVDFEVEAGETVALVGPTGAGKSTVLKLLLRLYDADSGAVRIDGTDVRDVTLPSLRDAMAYVRQETYLFYGTVAENIRYGSFDATREAVIEAATAAEAHEFITNLPDGYDTEVGERGVKLSGGQRQRIAIARAILKDPEILVLDEATSDVDTETEMLIQRSLDDLTADRTTFAIAHRLSTIKDADEILVFEGGRIVERGTHRDLIEADGLYAHLWAVQAGEIDDLPEEFVQRAQHRQARTDAGEDD